jgi:hypothetical protein
MLTPDQVVPFLAHADPAVRWLARDYFQYCGDPAPVTADDIWVRLDAIAKVDRAKDGAAASLSGALAYVPGTEASTVRLLDAVDALERGSPDALADNLQRAVRALDFDLFSRNRERALASPSIGEPVRAHLLRRLDLAALSAEAAWDQLMRFALALGDSYLKQIDAGERDALVEVVARHMDELGPRAVALLADPELLDSREIFTIDVVRRTRHAPALPALLAKLQIDGEVLLDDVAGALGAIGTDAVIDGVRGALAGRTWSDRIMASEVLRRIKRPAAEASLVHWVGREDNPEALEFFLHALCELGSLAGLEVFRRHLAKYPDHPDVVGLYERHLAVATMLGVTLPDEAEWRRRIRKRDADVARRMSGPGLFGPFAERTGRTAAPPAPAATVTTAAESAGPPTTPTKPIRNAAPKVGRNDPCPCGSGKKHKKCCGAPR